MQPPLAEQALALTASSTQSAAFNAKTRFLRLHANVAGFIAFGTNPTAVTPSSKQNWRGEGLTDEALELRLCARWLPLSKPTWAFRTFQDWPQDLVAALVQTDA